MSLQLKGTPVARGVVNRLSRVMMMTCGLPFCPFTYMKPSAPAPADLLMTTKGLGDSLCLEMIGEMNRAITSAPPPAPAGMMNSTGIFGSQAFAVPIEVITSAKEHATTIKIFSPENLLLMENTPHVKVFIADLKSHTQQPPPFF